MRDGRREKSCKEGLIDRVRKTRGINKRRKGCERERSGREEEKDAEEEVDE